MNADYLAVGENFGQGVERDSVGGIIESRHENDSVRNVEVGIARRQALTLEDNRSRHRQFDNGQALSILIVSIPQAAKVVLEWFVVWILDARFDDRDNNSRPDEPCEVVDVAMSVVTFDSPSEPNDIAGTKIVGEHSLDRCTINVGVGACTSLSRHSSVASNVPRPLTSMAPLSITILRR